MRLLLAAAFVAGIANSAIALRPNGIALEPGGSFLVCSPCAKKRGIGEGDLIEGATIVGGATLVALLADGASSLSF